MRRTVELGLLLLIGVSSLAGCSPGTRPVAVRQSSGALEVAVAVCDGEHLRHLSVTDLRDPDDPTDDREIWSATARGEGATSPIITLEQTVPDMEVTGEVTYADPERDRPAAEYEVRVGLSDATDGEGIFRVAELPGDGWAVLSSQGARPVTPEELSEDFESECYEWPLEAVQDWLPGVSPLTVSLGAVAVVSLAITGFALVRRRSGP